MICKPFYNYDIYENGQVFSYYVNRFLKPDKPHGYHQYTLVCDGVRRRFKVHKLVALLFIGKPSIDKAIVNHKDGNKDNNHFSNLEYCNSYENNEHARRTGLNDISHSNSVRWNDAKFRQKTSKAISEGIRKSGCNVGAKNPNFRYLITNSHNNVLSRKELSDILGLSLSRTDVIIKQCANGYKHPILLHNEISIQDTK